MGKIHAILVMVWLCFLQSHLQTQILAAAARLGAPFPTQQCMLARMVVAGPVQAAVVQRGLPPSAGAVFSFVC